MFWHIRKIYFFIITTFLIYRNVVAGPPFLTDDPVPVDYYHREIYLFSTIDHISNMTNILAPALELTDGIAPNTQLNIIVQIVSILQQNNNGPNATGIGDTEVGIKYRFLQETTHLPQVAIFPELILPTGDANRGLGNGGAIFQLPVLAQKSWEQWTTYGGGGYAINSAPDMPNYFFGGWLLQRDLSKKLTIGAEIFSQGTSSDTNKFFVIFNLGGYYYLTKDFSVLFTLGNSFIGQPNLIAYAGVKWFL